MASETRESDARGIAPQGAGRDEDRMSETPQQDGRHGLTYAEVARRATTAGMDRLEAEEEQE